MRTIKWYAHGYQHTSQCLESLEDVMITDEGKQRLAEQLRNKFYEVEFDVRYDEISGDIISISAKI